MSVTTPPSVDTLPAAPDPGNRATFNTLAYPWSAALPTFSTQLQALANNVALNATDCQANAAAAAASQTAANNSATAAAASAASSAAYAGATAWVSDTIYAVNDVRYSPANGCIYRRIIAGGGTIDPAADGTNWRLVSTDRPIVTVTGTTFTLYPGPLFVFTNVAAVTATLPAASGSGNSLAVLLLNGLSTNVLARASGTLMGSATDMLLDTAVGLPIVVRDISSDWRIQ